MSESLLYLLALLEQGEASEKDVYKFKMILQQRVESGKIDGELKQKLEEYLCRLEC